VKVVGGVPANVRFVNKRGMLRFECDVWSENVMVLSSVPSEKSQLSPSQIQPAHEQSIHEQSIQSTAHLKSSSRSGQSTPETTH
jgi:hypothetical protein